MPIPMLPTTESSWPSHLKPPSGNYQAVDPSMPPRVLDALSRAGICHGVTIADIVGPRGGKLRTQARRAAARELRALGMSLPEIGVYLNRHHTSVLCMLGLRGTRAARAVAYDPTAPDESGAWAI